MTTPRRRFWAGLGIILLVLILGYIAIRPFHLRWGATPAELAAAIPGDISGRSWTRAVTVNATPEQIWPWLVQFGQGRGGWYSYDWLENLLGFDIHTADRILPEFQNPQLGEPICMAPTVCMSKVSVIEPNRFFGWQAADDSGNPVWSFTLGLTPVDSSRTRLVVRESFDLAAMPAPALIALELPDTVMELKMLDTLKQRAEGRAPSPLVIVYEIAVWLAVFITGIVAFAQFVRCADWQKPLLVAIAAAVILLALTFLYPPLWLRGVLALGLIAALALTRPAAHQAHAPGPAQAR
jgi:hypothetical protein